MNVNQVLLGRLHALLEPPNARFRRHIRRMICSRTRIVIALPITVEVGHSPCSISFFCPISRDLYTLPKMIYIGSACLTWNKDHRHKLLIAIIHEHLWPTPRYRVVIHPASAFWETFWERKVILAHSRSFRR